MSTEIPSTPTEHNPPEALPRVAPDLLPMFDTILQQGGGDIAVQDIGDGQRLVVVGHPEHLYTVFHEPVFADKGVAYETVVSPVIGNGIITSSGQRWRQHRQVLAPPLRPQAIRKRVGEIADEGDAFVDDLIQRTEGNTPVNLQTEMTRLTFGVITRILCGKELALEAQKLISLADLQAVFDSLTQLRGSVNEEQLRGIEQTLTKLDQAVLQLVHAARQQPENDTTLSKLAYAREATTGELWSDKDVRDELVTLLFAGHETMGLSLTWLFHVLHQHPHILAKVQQELANLPPGTTNRDYHTQLPYLHKVIDETWRKFPPTPFISRSVTQPTELGGRALAPGDNVILSIWHAHHHPQIWNNPHQVDPDRFPLGDAERQAYFPFADGERGCLGEFLARIEAVTLAATLLRRTDIDILSLEASAVAYLTLKPEPPIYAHIARRALRQ